MRTMLATVLALVAMVSCAAWTSACPTTATWQAEHSGTTRALYDAGCLTAPHCFAVGDAGTLLATTNGGRSWHHETIPTKAPLYRVACAGPASCYVIARPSTIWVTHDAGAHWAARALPVHVPGLALAGCVVGGGPGVPGQTSCRLGLLDIFCASASTCYAVATLPGGWATTPLSQAGGAGPGSSLWLTRNGGATWTRQPIPSGVVCNGDCQANVRYGYPLEWVSCAPSGPCVAGGNQLIGSHEGFAAAWLMTPAAGGRWRLEPGCPANGCSEPVTDAGACPTGKLCYAVDNSNPFGNASSVNAYAATGHNGPGVTVPMGLVIEDIACPAARTCYTAGAQGSILRTTNGTRFAPVKAPARANLDGITCVTAAACYAVGAAGAIEALRAG